MSRLRLVAAGLLCLLAAGCGAREPIPEHDAWIDVAVEAERVVSGQAFPLAVTRIWRKDLVASAWDDALLAPLEVRAEGLERQEDAHRVRETRRFRAYAFALDEVRVRPVPFAVRPAAGGEARVVHAAGLTLDVRPTLLPTRAGAPELPGPPLADPPSRAPWILAGALVAVLLGLGLVAARRRAPVEPPERSEPEAPSPAADRIALDALAALRAAGGSVEAAAEILRAYAAARFAVRAPYLSTEEVLAAPRLADTPRERLAAVLRASDHAKFAAGRIPEPERAQRVDDAEAFVRETAEGGAS